MNCAMSSEMIQLLPSEIFSGGWDDVCVGPYNRAETENIWGGGHIYRFSRGEMILYSGVISLLIS